MRKKNTPDAAARKEARERIIQAANNHALRRYRRSRHWGRRYPVCLLGPRHIHQAVFRCRQFGLVDDTVLEAAGFNPRGVKR